MRWLTMKRKSAVLNTINWQQNQLLMAGFFGVNLSSNSTCDIHSNRVTLYRTLCKVNRIVYCLRDATFKR